MKKIIAIISFLAIAAGSFAQGLTVKGSVRDSKGEPVVGAVVMLENNTKVGSVTDANGSYTINLPSKSGNIVVSCISYKEQKIAVNGRGVINIVLEDDSQQLDEVVVVGYGAMRRSDLTGSVASVKIDDDTAAKSTTIDQMLEGRAAGVQVLSNSGNPDAAVTIRVRGIATFTGNSDPLYVVDGVIIDGAAQGINTMSIGSSSTAHETTNGLAGINPQDIASIEILKDASATAIYGSQGANGVVLITTKQATRDVPVIRFNAGASVSSRMNKIDVLGYDEFVQMLLDSGSITNVSYYYNDPERRIDRTKEPMDWQDYIDRKGITQRYYFSVSGRPNGYNYMFSLGYNRTEGIVVNSDSDNITARLNLDKSVTKKLYVGFKVNFGYTFSNILTGSVEGGNVTTRSSLFRSVLRSRPMILTTQEEDDDETLTSETDDIAYSPMRFIQNSTNTSERYRVTPSMYVEWKILKWLKFRSSLGGDFQTNTQTKTKAAILSTGNGNIAGVGSSQNIRFNWDNMFMVNKKWGGHSLSGTLGQTMSRNQYSGQSISGAYLKQVNARELAINTSSSDYTYYEQFGISQSSLMSFFGRAIYNYKDRYVLTSTLRFDGSSKFQGANKWGVFPSFAFAWRITKEPWFKVPFVSNAKLRLGWGQVGNQAISSYQTRTTFSVSTRGNHFADSGTESVFYPSNIANPALKWETSDQVNVGLDLSLWKGRATLTVDAYVKDTKDLLQNKSLPYTSGYSKMYVNDGSIRNSGIELTLDTTPLKIGNFEWALGGNIAFNRNQILDVGASGESALIFLNRNDAQPVAKKYFYGDALQSSGDTNPLNIFIEGQPMGLFYGYATDGIVQEGELGVWTDGYTREPGRTKYIDMNGDGILSPEDRTIIGNPMPDFTYGLNTSFSWKNFTIRADFSGAYGCDIYNMNNMQDYEISNSKNLRADRYYGAWTPENPNAKFEKLYVGQVGPYFSDVFVEDGSYFRISNIAVSYAVPINKKKAKVLHGLALSLSVGNVWVWDSYSGYSPLNNSFGSSVRRMGVDLNSGAVPRTYNFDVKFTF